MIDVTNQDARNKLATAVKHHYQKRQTARDNRKTLTNIFRGGTSIGNGLLKTKDGSFANLFQQFVKAQAVALAWRGPKYCIKARKKSARGFDKRIENFLRRYSEILEMPRIFRQCALDSSFGWAVVKIVSSIAPKGVTAPVAPRVFRINPDAFIVDSTAPSFDECAFLADMYLVPLDEARAAYPGREKELQAWSGSAAGTTIPGQQQNTEAFAQDYVRLIDIYIPTASIIATFPCQTDAFAEIQNEPLEVKETPICPYEVLSLLDNPDLLEEIARLEALRELQLLANDLLGKIARQARQAKRNPMGKLGSDLDLDNMLGKGDGEGVLAENPEEVGLYTLPGPDPSIVAAANMSMGLFSQLGGSIEVALGQAAGAPTARQTQSLVQQINASQSVDREAFERFAANVAKKLATLAFHSEALELEVQEQIPGTTFTINNGWLPPERLPRVAAIDDFMFEVVPYSSAYRSPEDRIGQLIEATGQLISLMQAAAAGAPINLAAAIQSYAEAYDLIPELEEWWSGEKPDPQQQAQQQGQYVPQSAAQNGSTVTYEGVGDSGSSDAGALSIPQVGGFSQ